jgi:hypothetical protein
MNFDFLSTLSPLALLVLLFFLFAVAVVVALWSLLTLGSSPRGVAVVQQPKPKKIEQPLRPNRFMRQRLETPQVQQPNEDDDLTSELPTSHVSRSRVKILKTLEPDPELEVPQFKPTTYDQLVKGQRVPKTGLPKADAPAKPKAAPVETKLLTKHVPAPPHIVTPPLTVLELQPPLHTTQQPRVPTSPLRTNSEDMSTQPSLFETGKRQRQPSVQREESEAAFRASGGVTETPPKAKTQQEKTQQEKDDAFEQFLRRNDDLNL